MEPARSGGIADGFANRHGEGNYVMLHAGFELEDAGGVDFGASANRGSSFFGNLPGFRERFGRGQLDLEPLSEFIRIAPDAAHLFAGVT